MTSAVPSPQDPAATSAPEVRRLPQGLLDNMRCKCGNENCANVAAVCEHIDELHATLAAERAKVAKLRADLEQVQARYTWCANELLACDYGDNEAKPPLVGWRLYGWRHRNGERRIYGPSIDIAVDVALAQQETGNG